MPCCGVGVLSLLFGGVKYCHVVLSVCCEITEVLMLVRQNCNVKLFPFYHYFLQNLTTPRCCYTITFGGGV